MYYGDLAALVALVLSRRRQDTAGLEHSLFRDGFRRYGVGLRLVVKACAVLSRWPDLVTTNSSAGLKSIWAWAIARAVQEVVANGIDVEEFKPDPAARAAVRTELGISGDAAVLAHVARVDPMKDHESFLAAMAECRTCGNVGRPGMENLPAALNVLRLGPRTDVARLFAAADIVVSSSAFGEGFSNVLAEGMACGLPPVATDVGDAKFIVGDTGVIVPPGTRSACGGDPEMGGERAAARAERGAKARARIVANSRCHRPSSAMWNSTHRSKSRAVDAGRPHRLGASNLNRIWQAIQRVPGRRGRDEPR